MQGAIFDRIYWQKHASNLSIETSLCAHLQKDLEECCWILQREGLLLSQMWRQYWQCMARKPTINYWRFPKLPIPVNIWPKPILVLRRTEDFKSTRVHKGIVAVKARWPFITLHHSCLTWPLCMLSEMHFSFCIISTHARQQLPNGTLLNTISHPSSASTVVYQAILQVTMQI